MVKLVGLADLMLVINIFINSKKFGFWRDTHGRIVGTAAFGLQETFIRDWNVSVRDPKDKLEREDSYFVVPEEEGNIDIQIVANGPESDNKTLRTGFIKMIMDDGRLYLASIALLDT